MSSYQIDALVRKYESLEKHLKKMRSEVMQSLEKNKNLTEMIYKNDKLKVVNK
jgi:predicted RNase H-like nuclease (RuvC/YqgF family)